MFERIDNEEDGEVYVREVIEFLRVLDNNLEQSEEVVTEYEGDCLNEIYDTLPEHKRNDEISLLYESSKVNLVAVKTGFGLTDRVNIPNIVQQGGTWGSMLCSNSLDTLGKKCRDRGEHCYLYKKTPRILPLAFVDDFNGISICGMESLNTKH